MVSIKDFNASLLDILSKGKKMMLVTGAAGFIGSHLCDFLVDKGIDVCGSYWNKDKLTNIKHLKKRIKLTECDIRDGDSIYNLIREIKPDKIFHMAAQSYVTVSWKEPERTLMTNIMGTFNLLEWVRKTGINPIIVAACSSAEYGLTYHNEIPIKEDKELRPTTPYAVSKVGTDMLCYQYNRSYGLKTIRVRLFNISGPRKMCDACSDFASGIVKIEKGKSDALHVGNLEAVRDVTDIEDAVRALWLLSEKGEAGEVYNVCSGTNYKIHDILRMFVGMAMAKVEIRQTKTRLTDDPIFVGDNSKIRKLGWKPMVPIEKTLSDMLEYWRKRVK